MQENELVQRIERLERATRRWRRAALALLLGCLVLLLAGFDYAQPNLINDRCVDALSFVLRVAGGLVRARMAIGDDGPRLSFYDEHGKVTSSLPLKPEIRPAR